jgi:hypothetical protein
MIKLPITLGRHNYCTENGGHYLAWVKRVMVVAGIINMQKVDIQLLLTSDDHKMGEENNQSFPGSISAILGRI